MTDGFVINTTERALRKMPAREWKSVVNMTYKKPQKPKAIILGFTKEDAEKAVNLIRGAGYICLYDRHNTPKNITVLKADMSKVKKILSANNIDFCCN